MTVSELIKVLEVLPEYLEVQVSSGPAQGPVDNVTIERRLSNRLDSSHQGQPHCVVINAVLQVWEPRRDFRE